MDTIVQHTTRTREAGRVASETITSHDPLNEDWVVRLGGGSEILFVDELAYPQQVGVGEPIDVRVQVVNAAITVGSGDEDFCVMGTGQSGFSYEVTVDVEDADTKTQQKCLQAGFEEDHEFDFAAPQQTGTYTMDITVEGTGTGFSGGGTREIEVVGDDDDDRDRDEDRKEEGGGDDPANDGNGGNVLWPPSRWLGTGEAVALGGGLALLLVLLIALR